MAPLLCTKSILDGNTINVFNDGNLKRDFTYIDDIVFGIIKVIDSLINEKYLKSSKLYNIENGTPIILKDFISTLEFEVGISAKFKYIPMQPGDVFVTMLLRL